MKENNSSFGTEPVFRLLTRLAPPVMLAQLIRALYNIVDSYFTYASDINASVDGNLSFRYGSHSTDYELFSEQVYLHLDAEALEDDKVAQCWVSY